MLVSFYRLSSRLGQPVRLPRILPHLDIEIWINLATRLGKVRILSFSEQVMIDVLDAAMVSQEGRPPYTFKL